MLSDSLWIEFIDIDTVIEKNEKMKIKQIVKVKWWNYFRQLESKQLSSMPNNWNYIIATGWWAPCYFDNKEKIKALWNVVWLKASEAHIISHIMKSESSRPSLTWRGVCDEVSTVLKKRTPIYKEIADFTVNIDEISDENIIVQKIIEFINSKI